MTCAARENEDVKTAWHWVRGDGTLGQDMSMRAVVGETLSLPAHKKPQLCCRGFHASELITDALYFAPGSKICRVEVWGSVLADHEKLVGRHRKVLWMLDAEILLWEHACWAAERALLEWSGQELSDIDERSLGSIEARRGWLRGEVTDEELDTAWEAAWEAASSAAGSAARFAAGSAAWSAARVAAGSAARFAASSAARAAARVAARAAARVAARLAAMNAARVASRDAVEHDLEQRVFDEARRLGFSGGGL